MQWLAQISVRRPVFATVLILVILVLEWWVTPASESIVSPRSTSRS